MAIDFGDANYGSSWHLVDVHQVDCSQGEPTEQPIWRPESNTAEWFTSGGGSGSGGGGTGTPPPVDPNTPLPVDEGMPTDLSPMDAFFWMMEHRIGPKIYFDDREKDLISSNFDLVYAILNYIQFENKKPVLTTESDSEAADLISLYGGLEAYAGPDPNVCDVCTEETSHGRPFCAPRSAFPEGRLGDFLYKIDRALAQSALFPGVGALRAPSMVFRAATFRSSLNALKARPDGLYDAHHILPQKFSQFFASRGINIHEPRFAVWWEMNSHRQAAHVYNTR